MIKSRSEEPYKIKHKNSSKKEDDIDKTSSLSDTNNDIYI